MKAINVKTKACEIYVKDRATRDASCVEKDAVLVPALVDFIKNRSPETFTALLMPSLYGRELYILHEHGVPMGNIFALEREKEVHKEILECNHPERKQFKGIQTTYKPLDSCEGIQYAYGSSSVPFDLIYLDFFSFPAFNHYDEVLKVIFQLNLLKPDGLLILTFGKNRTSATTKAFNDGIIKEAEALGLKEHPATKVAMEFGIPTPIMVLAAMRGTKYENIYEIPTTEVYKSCVSRYCTTIFKFNATEKA